MTNSYYHAFTPSFNWWYVVAVLFAVIIAIVGAGLYYMDGNLRIRRRYSGKLIEVLSVVFAIIVCVMIICESFDGLVQYFDNGLGRYESPIYSVLSAAAVTVMLPIFYAFALTIIGLVASWAKHGYLVEKRARRHEDTMEKKNPRA